MTSDKMSRIDKMQGFLISNKFIFASFALPVLIMVLAFAANGIYPFGEDQIAVIDMYHQYVPFLAELQYKLQEGGNLFYTWNGAGGSNFWNLMAYYGASPLNLLLALFPKKLIMEGVTFVLIIKVGLAGSFMALYLRYISRRCDLITVAFATLYALCSYVMAYYWCIMWIDAVALLPLCILGLNRLIDDGRAVMYVVSLALVVFSNYYMAIMVCIFIMFYYPVLYFIKVRGGGVKMCAATTGKAVGYSLLGVVMAAVMLFPTYISMQSTYYISSQMPDKWEIYNDALDVINQLLPYTDLTFREGLPNLYCGMIVVILLVLYALDQKVTLREKSLNGVFMLFMFFSLNTNKLDFLWHGLHFPNQLPFRYTFVICFLLIGIAYKTFLDIDRFSIKHLWTILAAGTGYYLAAQKLMAKQEYDLDLFLYGGIAWLIIYCGVMILYRKGYFLKQTFPVLIAIIIAAEMAAGACISFKEIGNSYREGYFANSKDIIKLAEKTSEEFSRTEMDYLYTLNSPAMYHYRGMSQFSSSINADTTYLMEKIGLDGSPGRNRFNYNQTAPPVNAMLNIKYLISKNEEIKDPDFKKVDTSGYSGLYESKYPLSIGYMTGGEIRTWDTGSENPFEVIDDYVRAATGNTYDTVFKRIDEPSVKAKNVTAKNVADGRYEVKSQGSAATAKVTLKYTAEDTEKYYVFIEAANADCIIASNGNKIEDIDIRNDCGSIVNIGTMKKGESFTIRVDYKKKIGDIKCHVRSLDYDTWDKTYAMLSRNMMEVTDFRDNHIEGTVTTDKSGVLVTSIPYDKGWTLKVNGVRKEISELTGNVWISVPLQEGRHEISLTFRPPGILAGLIITVVSALILALTQIMRKRRISASEDASFSIELPEIPEDRECQQEEADYNKI